jgi:hypothetical protein
MKNDEFAARVAETHELAAQGAVMSAAEVLEELSKLGRANMQDYLRATKDGDPYIDLSKLGRDQAAALARNVRTWSRLRCGLGIRRIVSPGSAHQSDQQALGRARRRAAPDQA